MATKSWIAPVLAAAACSMLPARTPGDRGRVERNGMEFRFRTVGAELECVMRAPTTGWVAIGFNPRSGLAGTNLIMGAVRDGRLTLSDRYIVAPGDHRAVTELGGTARLYAASGKEVSGRTEIRFRLPRIPPPGDRYHHALKPGVTYELLMAYSEADEFDHHSIMRTVARISL